MDADISPLLWLTMIAAVAVTGLVHGTLGLGFPVVATPLLASMRFGSRIDRTTYARWVRRVLALLAVGLVVQYLGVRFTGI